MSRAFGVSMDWRGLAFVFAYGLALAPFSGVRAEPRAPPSDPWLETCSDLGRGFFRLPGSEACLRLGGRLRFDVGYRQRLQGDPRGGFTDGRATLGAEVLAPFGEDQLKTTLRFTFERAPRLDGGYLPPDLEYAAIEWGGFTAGRATSFFDRAFPEGGVTLMGGGVNGRGSDRGAVPLLGYEHRLLDRWPVSISLEDPVERRVGVAGAAQGGARWPDLVLSYTDVRSWARTHVSFAVHETRPAAPGLAAQFGAASQLSWEIKVPYLADTTRLRYQSAVAIGASDYTGWGYAAVRSFVPRTADLWIGARGPLLGRTWSASLALVHDWSPTLRLAAFAHRGTQIAWPYAAWSQATALGANAVWRPGAGLELGAEAALTRGAILLPARGETPQRGRSAWQGRVRLQADF